jgi:CRP-like cAMP-binding protein
MLYAPLFRSGKSNAPRVVSMASNKQHLDSLRNVPLFSACTKKELEKVAKAVDEITMTAGTLLVDQGQTGREAFVVIDGAVAVKRNGRKIATLGAGDVVGELSLLDHGPRTATAVCETDCTLLVIDQRRFLGVIDDVPSISHKLLAALASRIRDLDRQYYG